VQWKMQPMLKQLQPLNWIAEGEKPVITATI
jgi:hypothetical protein